MEYPMYETVINTNTVSGTLSAMHIVMQQNSSKRPREWVRSDQRANVRRRTWSEERGESFFESLRVFHKKPDSTLKDDMLKSLAHNTALFKKNMRMRNSGKETGSRFAQLSDTSGLQSDHTGHGDTSSKGSRGVRRTSPSVCKESRNSRTFCQQAPERHRASSTATTSSDDLEIIGSPSLETKRLVRDLGQYVAGVKRKRAGRHRTSGDEESSEAATSASSSSSNVNPTPTLSQADRKNGQASTFKIVDIHSSSANSSDNDSSLPTSQSSPSLTFDDWEWGREEGRRSFRTFVASHGDIEEDSAPLVRAVKAYNLRPRQADKTYRETPSPVPETVQERRNRRKKQKHVTETSKEKPRHDCPCHNISICVRMLHAANEPFLATHVLNANRPPRMTPRLLSLLYPTHERLDDAELLGHRCRRR